MRVGMGYDAHRLVTGRPLILGGVSIPYHLGLLGHSDADVLLHAICDALLGAAGLGDIGTHFPDTDPRWKGVSSLLFLERTAAMLAERGLRIAWIDAVVIAERPKLGPHFPAMKQALAGALVLPPDRINLKAKTNEGLGELGRERAAQFRWDDAARATAPSRIPRPAPRTKSAPAAPAWSENSAAPIQKGTRCARRSKPPRPRARPRRTR